MIVDLIIGAIIIICIILGYKNGLIGVAFKFVSIIIAIILAILLHGPVSSFVINNTSLDEKIEEIVTKNINFAENKTTTQIEKESNLPKELISNVVNSIDTKVNETKENVQEAVSEQLAKAIINLAVIVILFIVIKVILMIIGFLTDFISDLPVVSQIDSIGGIVFGALEGIIIVYVLLAIAVAIAPFIRKSRITKSHRQFKFRKHAL